jgi:hypothetical protein
MAEVEATMTDVEELQGSFHVVSHGEELVENITIAESVDPTEFPFEAIQANHPELGEIYIFTGGQMKLRVSCTFSIPMRLQTIPFTTRQHLRAMALDDHRSKVGRSISGKRNRLSDGYRGCAAEDIGRCEHLGLDEGQGFNRYDCRG